MAGRRGGVNREALSLSQQGVAGGDSEEVRFVVGIHFLWLSWGSMGLDVGNSERQLIGAGAERWAPACWGDTSV